MGELVVNMFTSLDGVLQGPGAPDEDREGGFEYGGWQAPYFDEESGKVISDHIAGLEALLLGRKTYEIFAAYWPKQPAENPIAARLNLWVFPVLLGSGKRLFAEGTVPTALRLVESATFPKGAVHLTYERAGKPTFGSMA